MARILFVEDEAPILAMLERTFRRAGHEVSRATCRSEALDLALRVELDLIVIDIGLVHGPEPEHDGLAVCRALRDAGFDGAVVFLTGRTTESDQLAAFDLGIEDYVAKPCSLGELTARVEAVLRRTGRGRTLYRMHGSADPAGASAPPSRASDGTPPRHPPTDLCQVLRRVIAATERLHPEIVVVDEVPRHPCIVRHDRDHLVRLSSLLLSFAVDARRDGGHVRVSLREAAGGLEVSVTWRGAAVRGSRGGPEGTSPLAGALHESGSGLTIVRYIVEALAGSMSVESTLGPGATVMVSLPFEPPDAAGG